MKLRGRFTLTLALAALVPISVAAFVTTRVIAATYRSEYKETRRTVEDLIDREIARVSSQVTEATASLASQQHPFVGGILREMVKNQLDSTTLKKLREQGGPVMRGLSLDIMTITGPDDAVLISPHFRAATGEPMPQVRQRATATSGKAYFVRDKVMTGPSIETVLAAQAAQLSRDQGYTVAVWAGRRVTDDMLATVRRPGRVDARIVTPTGELLVGTAPKDWDQLAADAPIRKPLNGPDGTPVAFVEVAVSDGNLDAVLRKLTYLSAGLALAALGAVVLIGLLVARRMARDLDLLVEGSLAASRGDLDHRVPVRSKDEVGAVAAAFNFMMEDLRTSKDRLVIAERIAAWQDIARRLAHEIKNPLTPIQMAMDTLRKTWKKQHPSFGEILEESTATVLEEADRLKQIVTEFSDFARLPKPNFARIDLNENIRSAMKLYQGAVPIEPHLLDKLPQLDADKNQMTQVILNLVENARDAIGTRTGGKIIVATKLGDAGDRAVLVVEDNGPGVPRDVKDKIFTPYFTTKHAKGGTGLGLAIVHRIVADHGGRIVLSDVTGGGARFTIELPLRNGTALLASRI
jgi:two-component system, NtrC family, nitrogen regulation sensor histidine kinase NtrY